MELEKMLEAYSKNRENALNRSKDILPELKGKVDSVIKAMGVSYKIAQKIIAKVEVGKKTMKNLGEPLEQIIGASI